MPQVYAIIPVFNRISFTINCIECLKRQTYPQIKIVVVDGGSTDGTPKILEDKYEDIQVITPGKELWWTGAMEVGIDYALENGDIGQDFVLMVNNDVIIPSEYISELVSLSSRENAAVGGLVLDSADTQKILDAGEFIDWDQYTFPVRTEILQNEEFCTVDVLPGRGTLIPLTMINKHGNVDSLKFPHYIGDYDFFYRLKRGGCRLLTCYTTHLKAHICETGIMPSEGTKSFSSIWSELFSIRSMTNVRDHWRFIGRHAPSDRKGPLRRKLVVMVFNSLTLRTPLRPLFVMPRKMLNSVRILYSLLFFVLLAPGPFPNETCARYGLDADQLVKEGILRRTSLENWVRFMSFNCGTEGRMRLVCLFLDAWSPIPKIPRAIRFRALVNSHRESVMSENN